jgi:antitoxin PrlF
VKLTGIWILTDRLPHDPSAQHVILEKRVRMKGSVLERPVSVTSKGQVTVPAAVRRALGIKERDKVVFEIDVESGTATLRRVGGIADVYGSVSPRSSPEDFATLREEFERGVAQEAES